MNDSTSEIACESCVAACCKAPVNMQLTNDEYERHSKTMDLKLVAKPKNFSRTVRNATRTNSVEVAAGYGLFELVSGCANLAEDNRCSIYETRPQCCRDFAVGSLACLTARREAGLDADRPLTAEELPAPELDATSRILAEVFPTFSEVKPTGAAEATGSPAASAVPPLDLAAVRMSVARDAQWIGQQLAQCEAGSWSRRTRCGNWDVGTVALHLVNGLRLVQEVLTAAMDRRVAEIEPEFSGGRTATIEAFGRATRMVVDAVSLFPPEMLSSEVSVGGDDLVTVQYLLQVVVMELAVHGLDLARALGEPRHLSSDAVQAIAHLLPDHLEPGVTPRREIAYVLRTPAFTLYYTWKNNAWFHTPGDDPCYIDGDPEAVLLFALGRVPFNKSGLVTNRPDLAGAFKSHLVGP